MPLVRVPQIGKLAKFIDVMFSIVPERVAVLKPIDLAVGESICVNFQVAREFAPTRRGKSF